MDTTGNILTQSECIHHRLPPHFQKQHQIDSKDKVKFVNLEVLCDKFIARGLRNPVNSETSWVQGDQHVKTVEE